MHSNRIAWLVVLLAGCLGLGAFKACGPTISATLETPASPTSGKLPVSFTLTDESGAAGSVTLSWSTDGGLHYAPATVSGATSGLATGAGGTGHVVTWDSLADLGPVKATSILALVPKSGYEKGESVTSGPFVVDNSGAADLPPSALLLDPTGGGKTAYHGHVALRYKLSDPEGHPASIAVAWSADGGATFHPATPVAGTPTAGLAAPKSWKTHTFLWDSAADLGSGVSSVLLALTPSGAAPGKTVKSGGFTVDNGKLVNERGPYLQLVTPASILVVWTTGQRTTTKLDYGATPELGATLHSTASTTLHVAELVGLVPDTVYHYEASSSGSSVGKATFRTTPPPGSRFSFLAFGDCGTGSTAQYALAKLMAAKKAELALVLGDVVYPKGEQSDYTAKFFKPYKTLLPHSVAYATIGNHDIAADAVGRALLDNFYLPSNNPAGSERHYSFDYGDVHFVSLDCTMPVTPDSPQGKWFAADLAKTTQKWKIVYLHFTIYSSGWHGTNSGLVASLTPVMISAGVDLVLTGHDHHYERTKPIDGITYVVSGGGGTGLRSIWVKGAFSKVALKKHHFCHYAVAPDKIELTAIDDAGKTIDSFSLTK